MDATTAMLASLRRFASAVDPEVPAVEAAKADLEALLDAAGVDYVLVGGVAVIHHGYPRSTIDVDVLVDEAALAALDAAVGESDEFVRVSDVRLRHARSGTRIDLLVGGRPNQRPSSPPYPTLADLGRSERAPEFVDLPGLLRLKLEVGRSQDRADVVALLKTLDDAAYLHVVASLPPRLRPALAASRDEALEELSWER